MNVEGECILVTGAASGLGRASAAFLAERGAKLVLVDLPESDGEAVASSLGKNASFHPADVTSEEQMNGVFDRLGEPGALRGVVHCAGRGGALRILDREGKPGSLQHYESIVRLNLIGSFNVLRLAAACMARNDPIDDERGVIVLTASIAAYEGQIGQIPYASSKAGIVGMTLTAARDLAGRRIRVCTIAPGVFDTPAVRRLPQEVRDSLGAAVPNPQRLGHPKEFAMLAAHIFENPMMNGETVRLDGAMRMPPR